MRALTALTSGALASLALAAPAAAADLGYDPSTKGSLHNIAQVVGAHASYTAGYTGKGIGVALIDTGVSEVLGLDTGNVWHGPDLSFDSQSPELAHLDAYGHGTHLASIIAGRDAVATGATYARVDSHQFTWIAPDARLVSLKVAAADGGTMAAWLTAA